jgi:hypothetical protein
VGGRCAASSKRNHQVHCINDRRRLSHPPTPQDVAYELGFDTSDHLTDKFQFFLPKPLVFKLVMSKSVEDDADADVDGLAPVSFIVEVVDEAGFADGQTGYAVRPLSNTRFLLLRAKHLSC